MPAILRLIGRVTRNTKKLENPKFCPR